MALTDILNKIEEDAQREADALVSEAQNEADRIESESAEAVSKTENDAETARARAVNSARERVLASARHDAQFIVSEAKNAQIEKVFDTLAEKLQKMSEDQYRSLLETLLKDVPKDAEFVVAKEREEETRSVLARSGFGEQAIAKEAAVGLLGGCIARTNSEEYDLSFKTLIEKLKESHKTTVAKELFS